MAKKREAPTTEDMIVGADSLSESPRKGVKASVEATAGGMAEPMDDMGEFEDQWEDEVEDGDDEGEVVIAPDSDEEEDGMDIDQAAQQEEEDDEKPEDFQVYLPGQELGEGEELVADNSTYEMLHSMGVEWPCLSFDILHDNLGTGRETFPMTAYIVTGSQAERPKDNKLYIMKMSQLHRTKHDDDDEMADDDDDDLDEDPILESKTVSHYGGVNRLRVMPHPESHIVATWAETGKVHIFDLTEQVRALDTPGLVPPRNPSPIYTVDRHGKTEGYGLDWSSLQTGRLLTGDTTGRIMLTVRTPTAFETEPQAFEGHTASVEDIQWSRAQANVFASASVDKTVKIWDTRIKGKPQRSIIAHDQDVNVISWHRTVNYLLASGSDSGAFSVWDLRMWRENVTQAEPAASFKWHNGPITSIEWKAHESSVLAVAGADDQLTIWDLSLERDAEEEMTAMGADGTQVQVPPQLLFIHQGQKDIKELHWHPQAPGVVISTAFDGFNIFKTINS